MIGWCGGAGGAVYFDGAGGERVVAEVEFMIEDGVAGVGGFHVLGGEGDGDVEV